MIWLRICDVFSVYCDVCHTRICCHKLLAPFSPRAKYGHICVCRVSVWPGLWTFVRCRGKNGGNGPKWYRSICGGFSIGWASDEEGDDKLVSRHFLERYGVDDFLSLALLVLLVAATCSLARLGPPVLHMLWRFARVSLHSLGWSFVLTFSRPYCCFILSL